MRVFDDFQKAFDYIKKHPINTIERISCDVIDKRNHFDRTLDIEEVYVNPNLISDDGCCMYDEKHPELNTKKEFWLEFGDCFLDNGKVVYTHNVELDCGGDTFEDAIIELANLLYHCKTYEKYKDYDKEEKGI